MPGADVHFEVFVRRYPDSGWALKMATDVRTTALDAAKEMVAKGEGAAARVTREVLDADSGEFHALTILRGGARETPRRARAPQAAEPLCVAPQALYTCHARERIGRLLEVW